jgi:hypothetical protein
MIAVPIPPRPDFSPEHKRSTERAQFGKAQWLMPTTLTTRLQELIRQKINADLSRTADEVVQEALEAIEERNRLQQLGLNCKSAWTSLTAARERGSRQIGGPTGSASLPNVRRQVIPQSPMSARRLPVTFHPRPGPATTIFCSMGCYLG